MKIGMYSEDEIFEYMTECEGSMLGRSMYDAIFDKIHALITENEELKRRLEKEYENGILDSVKEVQRLEHNWNELKKWLEEGKKISAEHDNSIGYNFTGIVLDKISELEEGNK